MRVLIAGGGTGGHLFPGIAIADELRRRGPHAILFVGTDRGIESRAVPAAGYEVELLAITGLKRMGFWGTLKGLGRLPWALTKSEAILRRFRPDVVVGVGGYASGPMLLAAALSGYPTAIQEQNSVPGMTNRMLGKVVRRVFLAFEGAKSFFPQKKIEVLGNPIRKEILDAFAKPQDAVTAPRRVLVIGGSQGAKAVNELVLGAVPIVQQELADVTITHQTGASDLARIQTGYAQIGATVDARPFIQQMAEAYAQADLIIARAGALTLAELAVVGKPAIVIPLPSAADDHQTKNAQAFAEKGAAQVLAQATASPQDLAQAMIRILSDESTCHRMGQAMRSLSRPRATRDIVDRIQTLATLKG